MSILYHNYKIFHYFIFSKRKLTIMSKPKQLDQVLDAIRVKHYSMRTEEAYVHWIKRFIFLHLQKISKC